MFSPCLTEGLWGPFYKGPNPVYKGLPKAPAPTTITLGVTCQYWNFEGTDTQSLAACKVIFLYSSVKFATKIALEPCPHCSRGGECREGRVGWAVGSGRGLEAKPCACQRRCSRRASSHCLPCRERLAGVFYSLEMGPL